MHKTLSVINLRAVRANAQKIRALVQGKKLYAVVKADGYGHGAEEIARYIEDVVDGFCVAIIEEGVALRIAGITKPVLVFAPPQSRYDAARFIAYGLSATVNSPYTARLCRGLACHIKVNTGMNRYGCGVEELGDIIKYLGADSVEGVYSHLYAPADGAATAAQTALFERAVRIVRTYKKGAVAHLSASGGILCGNLQFDGVRAGLLLYGYVPEGFTAQGFTPALKVYARRMQTTNFIGGGIGYNYADGDYTRLSTYRCGYADGFLRGVPLGIKNLCMDAFIAQADADIICVMGDAREYAKKCGTIVYEVLTSVTKRSERVYER